MVINIFILASAVAYALCHGWLIAAIAGITLALLPQREETRIISLLIAAVTLGLLVYDFWWVALPLALAIDPQGAAIVKLRLVFESTLLIGTLVKAIKLF